MRYDITHVTTYDWGASVPMADCRLRLTPIERPGQRVFVSRLEVEPPSAVLTDGLDYFGNHVTRLALRSPHRRLTLRSTASVSVVPAPTIDPETTPPWEDVRTRAALSRDLGHTDPIQFLFPSRHVGLTPPVTAWTAELFTPGRPIVAGVLALTKRIHADFAYAPGTTEVATPLAEAFAKKRGVCQDFAHVMIAGLRGIGLPASYVGGYLRTVPPPGQPRLEGADAMHAWVEVWCGPTLGWLGFDPTNGILASDDHVVVAVGRDYADVSPVTGILISTGAQSLSVAVDVVESRPKTTAGKPLADAPPRTTATEPSEPRASGSRT